VKRAPNTTAAGEPFDPAIVAAVWRKARHSPSLDGFRLDRFDGTMHRLEFGWKTRFGWEIDHIVPVALGGTDDIKNLQPLHWQSNRAKADSGAEWVPAKRPPGDFDSV
jgi:hypothetical protein